MIAFALLTVLLLTTVAMWSTGLEESAPRPKVYAALGASDSVGVGADRPESEGWVPRVHAALPADTRLLNLGISGATLEEIVRDELPPAVDARPRWVTLWAGVNDLRGRVPLPEFQAQLEQTLAAFEGVQPRPTVLVLNVPDLRQLPAFRGVDPALIDATVRAWNTAIADAARRHEAILVDLYREWPELAEHPEYISADGFHPSSRGYARISDLVIGNVREHAAASVR